MVIIIKIFRNKNSFPYRFFKLFFENELASAAAEMAYYLILAFFPLLMVVHASFSMAISGFDIENTFFYSILPNAIEDLLDAYILHLSENSNLSFLFLGIVLTIYTITSFMNSMKKTVRKIYASENNKNPLAEIGTSFLFSILLLCSFFASIILIILGGQIMTFLEAHFATLNFGGLKTLSRFLLTAAVIFSVILLIYYQIPNVSHKAIHYFPGAIFSSAAWVLVSGIFSFYMNNFSRYSLIYGSIGAFIILLIWIYMSCLILLIGTCINAVLYQNKQEKGLTKG